jgi:hypothetical protein
MMKLAVRVGAESAGAGARSQAPEAESQELETEACRAESQELETEACKPGSAESRERGEPGARRAGSAESRERGDVETMELKSGGGEAEEEETTRNKAALPATILCMREFSCSIHYLVLCARNTVFYEYCKISSMLLSRKKYGGCLTNVKRGEKYSTCPPCTPVVCQMYVTI